MAWCTLRAAMRRAVIAFVVAIAFVATGCFPHNQKRRRIALGVEVGVMATSIAILGFSKPAVDCEEYDDSCRSRANALSGLGVFLLLASIGGLVATISSAEEAGRAPPKAIELTDESAKPEPARPAPEKAKPTPEPPAAPPPPPPPTPPPAP